MTPCVIVYYEISFPVILRSRWGWVDMGSFIKRGNLMKQIALTPQDSTKHGNRATCARPAHISDLLKSESFVNHTHHTHSTRR